MKLDADKLSEIEWVIGKSEKKYKLHSSIDKEEGYFLHSLIREDPTIIKTLEVGCAFGISSLYICSALQGRIGANHTIIDPFQHSQWDGVGVLNLEKAGIEFFKLIEKGSEIALPQLLEETQEDYDLVFIDGWHTFDHTLLDCFYATRLLRVGGLLVIDDVSFSSVKRVVEYIEQYPCYKVEGSVSTKVQDSWKRKTGKFLMSHIGRERLERFLSKNMLTRIFDNHQVQMIALRKTSEDRRNWDWDVNSK